MSLDIHKLQNGKASDLILSIKDSEIAELMNAFELFRSKTGLLIDPYGDIKFSSGFNALIQCLEETDSGSKVYSDLLGLLRESDDKNVSLIFVGD